MDEEWDHPRRHCDSGAAQDTDICISEDLKHIFNSLVTWMSGLHRRAGVKNVCRCWYGTQGLRAVMWQSRGCEGGATVPLPSVGDKSCEHARGRLLDRLDVRQAQVSQASHKVTGWVLFQPNSLYTTTHTPVGQSSLTDQQSNNGDGKKLNSEESQTTTSAHVRYSFKNGWDKVTQLGRYC